MRLIRLPAAVLAGLTLGLLPGAASASCAEFPPLGEHLDQAEVVFVGTVVALTNLDRTAEVAVEEVWRGEGIPARVTVHGGEDDPTMMTSVDRTFVAGTRYLFAATFDEGGLRDDSCTATREWSEDLAEFRPTSVSTPEPAEGAASDGVPVPAIGIVLAVLAIGAVSVLAFRARL